MPEQAMPYRTPVPQDALLFFTGGTALSALAAHLAQQHQPTVHVVTTFDSGGSSAVLRQAFSMPAVGDLRARLVDLADLTQEGVPELVTCFRYRLPSTAEPTALLQELTALEQGQHPLTQALTPSSRHAVQHLLQRFMHHMPPDLDLQGASLGNLVLTAAYLEYGRSLHTMIAHVAPLLHPQGAVLPVSEDCAHLCVALRNGQQRVGQHCFTSKKDAVLDAPITALWQSPALDTATPCTTHCHPTIISAITTARLICYPIGSFFSSVLANLLPVGVIEALQQTSCPTVFLPNPNPDPELLGLTLLDQLVHFHKLGVLPSILLVDANTQRYAGGLPLRWLTDHGVRVLAIPHLAHDTLNVHVAAQTLHQLASHP